MLKFQFSFSYYHLPQFHTFFSFSAPLSYPQSLEFGLSQSQLVIQCVINSDVVIDLEDLHMKQFNDQALNK